MSQKRRKKRNAQGSHSANPGELRQTEKTKRLDPGARNLLYADLIFLAAGEILSHTGHLSQTAAAVSAFVGLVLIAAALYLQFRPKDRAPKEPKR